MAAGAVSGRFAPGPVSDRTNRTDPRPVRQRLWGEEMTEQRTNPDLRIHVANLEQALRARTFELEVLHELSARIGASLTYEELSRAILIHLAGVIHYEVAASLLIEAGSCCHL